MVLDLTYIVLVLPAVILSLWASWNVKHTFKKYSKVLNSRSLTGADAARRVLDANGLRDIPVEHISGELSDHYDPEGRIVRLSDSVWGSTSVAAVGVACHEVGHAIQNEQDYLPIKVRQAIIPATALGEKLSVPLLILGLILSSYSRVFIYLAYAGVALYAICAVFQLVTLPTEFDASRRALVSIQDMNLLDGEELKGAKKVLSAAALTYVAALATTLMQLLRFIILVNDRKR